MVSRYQGPCREMARSHSLSHDGHHDSRGAAAMARRKRDSTHGISTRKHRLFWRGVTHLPSEKVSAAWSCPAQPVIPVSQLIDSQICIELSIHTTKVLGIIRSSTPLLQSLSLL
eukprot:260338-Rhodomonas_salina.2